MTGAVSCGTGVGIWVAVDADGLLHGDSGEHDIVLEDVRGAAVEVVADGGQESAGGAEQGEAAGVGGADLVGAVGAREADGSDLALLDELHARARHGLAESVGDAAADDDCVRRDGQQNDCRCGEKNARGESCARKLTVRLQAPIQEVHYGSPPLPPRKRGRGSA